MFLLGHPGQVYRKEPSKWQDFHLVSVHTHLYIHVYTNNTNKPSRLGLTKLKLTGFIHNTQCLILRSVYIFLFIEIFVHNFYSQPCQICLHSICFCFILCLVFPFAAWKLWHLFHYDFENIRILSYLLTERDRKLFCHVFLILNKVPRCHKPFYIVSVNT